MSPEDETDPDAQVRAAKGRELRARAEFKFFARKAEGSLGSRGGFSVGFRVENGGWQTARKGAVGGQR